jgi:hypothetical protein
MITKMIRKILKKIIIVDSDYINDLLIYMVFTYIPIIFVIMVYITFDNDTPFTYSLLMLPISNILYAIIVWIRKVSFTFNLIIIDARESGSSGLILESVLRIIGSIIVIVILGKII